MGADQRANEVLGTLLAELGWSPNKLAGALNGLLGPGSVARSTVSDWLNQDRLPRDPLPTVVAHLISDALDREVSVVTLWSGRAQPAEFWVAADHGLQLPWSAAGTVKVFDDWLGHSGGSIGMDRRIFLAVSGASLTAPAWGYVERLGIRGDSFAALADARRSITITSAMVDAVAAATAGIRDLGNTEGGNEDNLRFVHHHLIWVAKLLRQARFTSSAVANRLLAEWAQLAQLAAWMAMDAGRYGLSQRYVTSGLHAAHTAGDRSVGTYLLSDLGSWRVIQGRLGDGVDLGRAARDAVELANAAHEVARSTPAVVRALAASGFAKAQAAVGNTRGFHAAADRLHPNGEPVVELDDAQRTADLHHQGLAAKIVVGIAAVDDDSPIAAGMQPHARHGGLAPPGAVEIRPKILRQGMLLASMSSAGMLAVSPAHSAEALNG